MKTTNDQFETPPFRTNSSGKKAMGSLLLETTAITSDDRHEATARLYLTGDMFVGLYIQLIFGRMRQLAGTTTQTCLVLVNRLDPVNAGFIGVP